MVSASPYPACRPPLLCKRDFTSYVRIMVNLTVASFHQIFQSSSSTPGNVVCCLSCRSNGGATKSICRHIASVSMASCSGDSSLKASCRGKLPWDKIRLGFGLKRGISDKNSGHSSNISEDMVQALRSLIRVSKAADTVYSPVSMFSV